MSANIRRQIFGLVARFFPPGHSSRVNDIGQFSMPIRTPQSSASLTSGRQVSRNRGQLSSTDFVQSRPTNVFIRPMPSRPAARITLATCSVAASASLSFGESGLG